MERGLSKPARYIFPLIGALIFIAAAAYWFLASQRGSIDSIAIMPLSNAGGDPNTEYLSEGISESLITGLSRVPRIRVKSWDTVFRYNGQNKDVQQVGRDLSVRAVLKGRLVKRGDSLSIRVELIDTRDGTVLWRNQYSSGAVQLPAIEHEISNEITEQLQVKLTGEERRRLAALQERKPDAYQLYLQGRYAWNRRTEEALKTSAEYFHQAIEKDPGYAQAWAGLADAFVMLGFFSSMPPGDAFPRAHAAATRAVAIDQGSAEARTALGFVKTVYNWDWPGAEQEYMRAVNLNAQYATARQYHALYMVGMGRLEEGVAEIERAREIDPTSLIIVANVGLLRYFARQYELAAHDLQKTIGIDSSFARSRVYLGMVYTVEGKRPQAVAEVEKGITLSNRGLHELSRAGTSFALLGENVRAEKLLRELTELSKRRYVAPYLRAMIHAGLGQVDEAFECFGHAIDEGSLPPWFLRDPMLDGIRADRRFKRLLQRMRLSG